MKKLFMSGHMIGLAGIVERGDNNMGTKLSLLFVACLTIFLCLPSIAGADQVPWLTQSYGVHASSEWTGETDEKYGLPLPLSASVSEEYIYLGTLHLEEADSQITDSTMFVSSKTTGGRHSHSTASTSFKGTYDASTPYFFFMYGNDSGGGGGSITVKDLTSSTILLSENIYGDISNTYDVPTAIGHKIEVSFGLMASTAYNGYESDTLTYNMAVAPEPISSILFITGGTLLAGRRFIRRKA